MSEQLPANWTDEETGLACAVIVGPLGALNGYVAVAPSHPWFKVGYSEQLCDHEGCWEHDPESVISVHGGLTYSGIGVEGAEKNEGRWWFGFDYVPGMPTHFAGDVERPFAYVKNEVQALARQLAAVTPETGRA